MRNCPDCGRDNPDDASFCNSCGHVLAAAQQSLARKTVTIVFCDMTGSTALAERLDPESMRVVMSRYFDTMRAAIERHGGTVEKFIGDAVMAVFGVPQLHEDDALRAVRAAAEMRDAMLELNKELERDLAVSIAARIGVNTGEVVTGEASDALVTGDAVNVAARLEQAAAPGEVLIGEATYALAREIVVVEPAEPLSVKGKSDPLRAHRLLEVAVGTASPARAANSPMVGRARELAALDDAFERSVSDQTCCLFTVLGGAGEGKSRLVDEFVARLGDRATVLRGHCLPYGQRITYWPVREVVSEALSLRVSDVRDEAAGQLEAALAGEERAVVVAARLAEVLGVNEGVASADETHWAVRRFFEVVASTHPLVIVFDDIQWGEPTFLDLVDHVTDWSRDAPILVVCMARPELLELRPGWAGGKVNATTTLLRPLDDTDCGRMIENLLGDAALAGVVRQRISEASEGNPLFLEQMLSMLVDDGAIFRRDGSWVAASDLAQISVPPTIASVLSARLDRLGRDERAVVDAASVIGQQFSPSAVRQLVPEHIDVEGVLMALRRKELVRAGATEQDANLLRFSHLLVRDAAYGAIAKRRRSDLHVSLASWLEASSHSNEHDDVSGYHLEQAYRLREQLGPLADGDRELGQRAAVRLADAGYRALSRDDMPATVGLLSRASALFPADDAARIMALSELGYALAERDAKDEARALLDEALAAAVLAGDDRLQAHVGIRRLDTSSAETWLSDIEREIGGIIDVFEQFDDHRGLARAWRLRSELDVGTGHAAQGEVALARALDHARKAGDSHEEAHVIFAIGYAVARGPTPVDEGIRWCEDVIASSRTSRSIEAYLSHPLGHLFARRRAFDKARACAVTLRDFQRETGQMWAHWVMSELAGDIEALAGDNAAAARLLAEGAEQLERLGERSAVIEGYLAHYLYDEGDVAGAERFAAFAASAPADLLARPLALSVLGKIAAGRGDADKAVRLASEAVAILDPTDFLIDHAIVLVDLGDVLATLGRRNEAVAAYERALSRSAQKGDLVATERTCAAIARLAT